MKRFALLITLALAITIGGVYATWVYSQSDDVADISGSSTIALTEATFTGTYGTYHVDTSSLKMTVDPATGTTHDTALYIDGFVTITFTPNTYAPETVKQGGVASTYKLALSNDSWTFDDGNGAQPIMTLNHPDDAHDITWSAPDAEGKLSFTIDADTLAGHLSLTTFTLDTKTLYDAYDTALTNGQIVIHVSDGKNASTLAAE